MCIRDRVGALLGILPALFRLPASGRNCPNWARRRPPGLLDWSVVGGVAPVDCSFAPRLRSRSRLQASPS
eukprot:6378427-Alexandrium_andersonii.AAC.1